jgi:hypothetical protein
MTKTSAFGTGKREGHDSSRFYELNLYNVFFASELSDDVIKRIKVGELGDWVDK